MCLCIAAAVGRNQHLTNDFPLVNRVSQGLEYARSQMEDDLDGVQGR